MARRLVAPLLLLLATVAAQARAAARLHVVVRVASPDDLARSTRLRGQVSDLPVEITEAPSATLEPRLRDQVAAADLLTRQLRADVAIWFTEGQAHVLVSRPPPGHVLTLAEPAAADPSARFEQTALRLRRVLRTVLDGGVVGIPRDAAPEPEPVAPPPPAPPEPGDPPLRVLAALGAEQLFDGVDSATGIAAQLGVGVRRFEAALAYDEHLLRALASMPAPRRLGRRTVALQLGFALLRLPFARAFVLARGGLAVMTLDAQEREFKSADDVERRPVAGLGARLDFPLLRSADRGVCLRFWASGHLDAMWDPPAFEPGFPVRGERHVSAVQPRVGLGLSLEGG